MPGNGHSSDDEENRRIIAQERPLEEMRPGEAVVVSAAEIQPVPVSWLCYPYFPLGKLCIIGGEPGVGKTWIELAFAASHSLGQWPVSSPHSCHETGNTLLFVVEDGLNDTVVPRLLSLGADLRRIHFVRGKLGFHNAIDRMFFNDTKALTDTILRTNAKLVFFDPIQAFLPKNTESNKIESVRPVTQNLIAIAESTGACIVLLGHLSKSKQESLTYKFHGSVDWSAAVRSAMMIGKDKEDSRKRWFFQLKNSLGPQPEGLSFSLTESEKPFAWGEHTQATAEEVFNAAESTSGRKTRAVDFLTRLLANGPVVSEEIFKKGKEANVSRNALFEAKDSGLFTVSKSGFSGKWFWSLKQGDA